jgi:hypothetical protein
VQAAEMPPKNVFEAFNPGHDTIALIAPDGTNANLRAEVLNLFGSVFFRSFLSVVPAPPDCPLSSVEDNPCARPWPSWESDQKTRSASFHWAMVEAHA